MRSNTNDRQKPSEPSEKPLQLIPIEAVALAGLTVLLYLAAGSYQLGYEGQFGYTYLSLGVEDLFYASLPFLLPLVIGTTLAIAASVVIANLRRTWRRHLPLFLYVSCPAIVILVAYMYNGISIRDLYPVDPYTYYVLIFYYIVVIASILLAVFRINLSKTGGFYLIPPSKVALAAIAAILLAYDVGAIEAHKQSVFELCPNAKNVPAVVLDRVGDLIICAEIDPEQRVVYASFLYMKVPEAEKAQFSRVIRFDPSRIAELRP